jgi:hypothetical protein
MLLFLLVGQEKKHLRFNVSACFYWSHLPESNWRPIDYESIALPTELRWPVVLSSLFITGSQVLKCNYLIL